MLLGSGDMDAEDSECGNEVSEREWLYRLRGSNDLTEPYFAHFAVCKNLTITRSVTCAKSRKSGRKM